MTNEQLPREILKYWRSSWEMYLKTVKTMQEQADKMLELILEQSDVFRDEMKKSIRETAGNMKEVQSNYIQAIEQNLSKIEGML